MSRITAGKKIYEMSRRLSELKGGSTLLYYSDALWCSFHHGASPENYFVLRFFEMKDFLRKDFLTSGRSKQVDRLLNQHATVEDKKTLGRKSLFNKHFAELVRRESVFASDSTIDEFSAFLDRHTEFIQKPDCGTMGKGIKKCRSSNIPNKQEYFEYCKNNRLLLEEIIVQHPQLNKINAGCVNSIRINAARRRNGSVCLVGACLKCGVSDNISDNFHAGGIAYPLDKNTGTVTGPGRNNCDLTDYFVHPGSNTAMQSFSVPFWNEIEKSVLIAMDAVPSLGYVGWDIAVTPEGPELIEGNFNWPGGNIIQFDGVGKYPLILSCLGESL